MVTSSGFATGGTAIDQLGTAALSTLTHTFEIPDDGRTAGEAVLGLFSAFSAVHDSVKLATSRDGRNNTNNAPNVERDLEPFLQTIRRLSEVDSDNARTLPHDRHTATRRQSIAMRTLRLATVEANIFVAAHGGPSLGSWQGASSSSRSERDGYYAEALALRDEIERLRTHVDTLNTSNDTGPLSVLQSQVETLRSDKVDELVRQQRWAEATTELRLLVDLKGNMIQAHVSGTENHVTDPLAKTMKVQLSNYQYRLGSVLHKSGNATEAAQWIRKAMKTQKSELGVNDAATRDSISNLCDILTNSESRESRYEGERLLFLESHRPTPDEFAMRCATQLGKSYIQHQNYHDARATFLKLWKQQKEQGCQTAVLLRTAEPLLITLTHQSDLEEATRWRKTLWRDYPQDFVKTLPSEALTLGLGLVCAKRWDETRPILRQLWEDSRGCTHPGTANCTCPACSKKEQWFHTGLLYCYCLTNDPSTANQVLSQLWQAIDRAPRHGASSVSRLANQYTQVLEQRQSSGLESVCRQAWQKVRSISGYETEDPVMTLGDRYARCLLANRRIAEATGVAREVYRMRRNLVVAGNEESRRKAHQSCQLLINCLNDISTLSTLGSFQELSGLRTQLSTLAPAAPITATAALFTRRLSAYGA